MRYLFFADIHGNGPAFESFIKQLPNETYDKIIFIGDFMGYYYDSLSVLRYCRDNNIECVLGNHDAYFLQMLDGSLDETKLVKKYGQSYSLAKRAVKSDDISFLRSLPQSISLNSGETRILVCHGSPLDHLEGRIYPDTDLTLFSEAAAQYNYIICANTHHKIARPYRQSLFLNPGSLGQQRDGKGCSYLLLDTSTSEHTFKIVTYDIEELEKRIDLIDQGSVALKSVLRRTK